MLFNSYIYIILFLPIACYVYYFLKIRKKKLLLYIWLIGASLFFYAWWNSQYILLIITSIIINFFIGNRLRKSTNYRKLWLFIGIAFNLLLLAYFKYKFFIIANINNLFSIDISNPSIILPLAISFFTFQQISYLVDTYHQEIKTHQFSSYILYISFFPQLIAGPIVHHKEMMPQFNALNNKISWHMIACGLFIFSIGLFKKVEIADYFARFATDGFEHAANISFIRAWITILSYTLQIYFDFSGYTDMAIGSALLFGIKLPFNFNSPYRAFNIQDFWHRWHMTLSRFLRDYVYIPLGGNRKGLVRTYININITFIIGGLWHGASWTFVIWGLMHGLALSAYRLWQNQSIVLPKLMAWLLTFLFINITWVVFRAESITQAIHLYQGMFAINTIGWHDITQLQFFTFNFPLVASTPVENTPIRQILPLNMLPIFILLLCFNNTNFIIKQFKPSADKLLFSILMLYVSMFHLSHYSEFLYFQF